MPAQFGTPVNGSGSSAPRPKARKPEIDWSVCSVTQARLHYVVTPGGTYFRTLVHWFNRMNHNPQRYPSRALVERLYVIAPEHAHWQRLVENPPPTWTGADWLRTKEREQFLLAQITAIEDVLASRAKLARARSRTE